MSDHQHVRVTLRQVIIVGGGPSARYAKVLTGIRQPVLDERLCDGEAMVAVDVHGYVTGVSRSFRVTPVEPHTYLLSGYNILSIEDLALEPDVHFEACPPRESGCRRRQLVTRSCATASPHAAHEYRVSRAVPTSCPGA